VSCAYRINDSRKNHSKYYEALSLISGDAFQNNKMEYIKYRCYADQTCKGYYKFSWQGHIIEMYETPGHSKGSSCIVFDNAYLFLGDTLLPGSEYNKRLPGGDRKALVEISKPIILQLPKHIIVYPGHGDVFHLSEFLWDMV